MDPGMNVPSVLLTTSDSPSLSLFSIRRIMFPVSRFLLVLNFVLLLLVSSQVSTVSAQLAPVVYDIPRLRPKPPSRPSSRRSFRPMHHQTPFLSSPSSFDAVVPFADEENSGQETRLHEGRARMYTSASVDASSSPSPTSSSSSTPLFPERESLLPSSSASVHPVSNSLGAPELPLTRQCLKCICNANSNCDENIKCVLNEFCGPYLISYRYWTDAGRPGSDYKSCVFNKTCAEQTVQTYMSKNYVDCNGDKFIDCDDFVAIHQLGPKQCQSHKNSMTNFYSSNYWNYYQYCYHLSPSARREDGDHGEEENIAITNTRRLTGGRRKASKIPRFTVRPTPAPAVVKTTTSTTPPPPPTEDMIEISSDCMNCLCEANGCNKTIPCDENSPLNRGACGPFLLDYNYWLDAGPAGQRDSPSAFVKCANDRSCAESVVRRYLNKWANDCNSDGFVDCLDYAVLHRLGPKYCNSETIYDSLYFQKFQNCFGFDSERTPV